jgi:hypothetical protein
LPLIFTSLRSVLVSIFRRPRETSVIVKVNGKRVELKGPLDERVLQQTIALLRAQMDQAPARITPLGDEDQSAHEGDTGTGARGDQHE